MQIAREKSSDDEWNKALSGGGRLVMIGSAADRHHTQLPPAQPIIRLPAG